MNTQIINSQEVKNAVIAGYKNHRRFYPLGKKGVPYRPIFWNGFWFDTLKSNSIIHTEGKNILKELENERGEIQAVIIGHEAPKLLGGPVQARKPIIDSKKVMEVVSDVLPVLASVMDVLVKGLATVATTAAIAMAMLGVVFVEAILIDPVMIVVLKDGTWLKVATWYE